MLEGLGADCLYCRGGCPKNIKNGIPIEKVGLVNNPYREWIGADIRSDPWAYVSPGMPWKAAGMAWNDGFLTHRGSGLYGEIFFAAAISAAFVLDDPMEAFKIGLKYIPPRSRLAQAVQWAIEKASIIKGHEQARELVDQQFPGMSEVHTINNACLTIFGISIGGTDYTKVVSQTVAMGMDNDCTGATAGSLIGAIIGKDNIPAHWTSPFNDTVYSYLNNHEKFSISDVVDRFYKIGIEHVATERK